MQPKPDLIRIRHALDAARKAVRFTRNVTVAELRADEMRCLATLHAVSLVGEALGKVSAEFRAAHPEIPWAKAIGMRNRLIHGYDDIDHKVILETANVSLPALIDLLEKALGEPAGEEE